jgi:hypothetical protein
VLHGGLYTPSWRLAARLLCHEQLCLLPTHRPNPQPPRSPHNRPPASTRWRRLRSAPLRRRHARRAGPASGRSPEEIAGRDGPEPTRYGDGKSTAHVGF